MSTCDNGKLANGEPCPTCDENLTHESVNLSWEQLKAADIRQAGHKLPGFRGPSLCVFDCPECGKHRMYRQKGHEVSTMTEEVEINGIIRIKHVDICHVCTERFTSLIKKELEQKTKKAVKLAAEKKDLGNLSLEDAL